MISVDFAPNESWDDAWLSLKLSFQPWLWKRGNEQSKVKSIIKIFISSKDGETKFSRDFVSEERSDELSRVKNFDEPLLNVSLFLSGRSALYNYIKCLTLPVGSEILVQAFTCEAVILPIIANGLKPVYVDIEAKTYSMSPIDLKRKVAPKSKLLILQHTFGLTPDSRNEILALVRKHKLLLIEDIAHKLKYIASDRSSQTDAYLLSFGRSKALSSVFGGAIVTKNTNLSKKLDQISKNLSYPRSMFILLSLLYKPFAMIIKSTYDIYLGKLIHFALNKLGLLIGEITNQEKMGEYDNFFDKKYPNCLAALLINQLNKYPAMQKQRELIGKIYDNKSKDSLPRYPLLVEDREALLQNARKQNIFLGKWYDQVVAPKDLDLKKVGYKIGSCPVAEEICKKIINLPTLVSQDDAKKVISLIKP